MKDWRLRVVIVFLLGTVGPTAAAQASPIRFNFSSVFNADVIANSDPTSPTGLDLTQQSIDTVGYAFITRSAEAVLLGGASMGLPDDAFFPAVVDFFDGHQIHPDVQLAYRDSDSGYNARSTRGSETDTFTVAVPALLYSNVYLFATAGQGSGVFEVLLNYSEGDSIYGYGYVPDWFASYPPDPTYGASTFALIRDRSRVETSYHGYGSSGASIWGYGFASDPARALTSLDDLGKCIPGCRRQSVRRHRRRARRPDDSGSRAGGDSARTNDRSDAADRHL